MWEYMLVHRSLVLTIYVIVLKLDFTFHLGFSERVVESRTVLAGSTVTIYEEHFTFNCMGGSKKVGPV